MAFAFCGVFPFWAALLILVRDVAVLLGGAALLWGRDLRVDVRVDRQDRDVLVDGGDHVDRVGERGWAAR